MTETGPSLCAAAYLRVSTGEQAEFSPDAQLAAIRAYAEKNGYALPPELIFADEGISGRKAEKRPAFQRMIARAKEKPSPFQAILVHKFDRFARSREDSVVYKSLLRRECGVKVISITENIEEDKFAVILEAILEAMAEYYSINLSEEVKKGMTEKARRGGLQSAPGFGYAVQDNVLVPVAEEAEIVREIFRRFADGEGYFAIARYLNALGVRTRRGKPFESRAVEYILRNPVYIGKLRWNPAGKTGRGDAPGRLVADGLHEPIIGPELWGAAQARADALRSGGKRPGRPASEHRDWLSGLVKCGACGRSLVRSGGRYWKCGGYAKGVCVHSQHIPDTTLKAMVLERLPRDLADLLASPDLGAQEKHRLAHEASREIVLDREGGGVVMTLQDT